jgi:CRP-like cAMP-binding protein
MAAAQQPPQDAAVKQALLHAVFGAPSPAPHPARHNQLLAALTPDVWARWQPLLQEVELHNGQVLCRAGGTLDSVFFPTGAVVSLLHITREGASAEVAVIGREGLVGLPLIMGGNATPGQAVVQASGAAWRLAAHAVRDEVRRAGPALQTLLRYAQALAVQVGQTAACNRHHSIDQQLCRRLLLGLDRSDSDELVMTHESVANLLGVRREGVTAAAGRLRQDGLIHYHRGRIRVLDRKDLERRTCECYSKVRCEHERLLPPPGRGQERMPLAA